MQGLGRCEIFRLKATILICLQASFILPFYVKIYNLWAWDGCWSMIELLMLYDNDTLVWFQHFF